MYYRILYVISLIISATAITLHFAGFFTYSVAYAGMCSNLVVLAFGVFFVIVRAREGIGRGSSKRYKAPSNAINTFAFFKYVNIPLLILTILIGIYVFANFFLTLEYLEGGGPWIIDGSYYLANHGEIIRQIDFEFFQKCQLAEYRMSTGHSMVFSLVISTYYSFRTREVSAKIRAKEQHL